MTPTLENYSRQLDAERLKKLIAAGDAAIAAKDLAVKALEVELAHQKKTRTTSTGVPSYSYSVTYNSPARRIQNQSQRRKKMPS
jgi:exonuclease III